MKSNMFIKVLAISAAVVLSVLTVNSIALAVPALPDKDYTLTQADGTTMFTARQWGDEWSNGWETGDGYSIVFDTATDNWMYAEVDANGWLIPSAQIVDDGAPPAPSEGLRPSGNALAAIKQARATQLSRSLSAPVTGTASIPVLLVNFVGTTTAFTTTDFATLLFGITQKNMTDYYQEVSYGAFSVTKGPGNVAGWYQALDIPAYFGTNTSSGAVRDQWPGDLVYQAAKAADAVKFNFAPYDSDGDCKVDVVFIVHQGTGEEESGVTTDIWSHKWSLSGAHGATPQRSNYGPYLALNSADPSCPNGYEVDDYILVPEQLVSSTAIPTQSTLGVFVHEYGHVLGLPDLYDVDHSSEGIGFWGVMGKGSWGTTSTGNPGDKPVHLSAWSKYALGWVTPTRVFGTLTNEQIDEATGSADVYQLLAGTPPSGEYYLVENRAKTRFDIGLPWEGLLIWHVDGDLIANKINSHDVNTDECNPSLYPCPNDHYGVALVQADDLWQLES
ncbi:MAG TPA: hypothetical protein DCO77_03545, partial [Nitrospiraceae bacterium]|nr:hypothetical protein [Nitrospiraceae bacterium]